MHLSAGARLGPYEILGMLGVGGMGEVYRARDTRLDRLVAVKVLRPATTSPQSLERFEREARAIAALNHPNICTVHDVGAAEPSGEAGAVGQPLRFLVMELLDGETLHERLVRGPLEPAQVVEIGLALADALAAAHASGVIHRDLKPANIMLTARGPKILDFGLAKPIESRGVTPTPDAPLYSQAVTAAGGAPLTDPGIAVGTVTYMSPEQLRGEPLDARTDLFSLGLVLYEMATGHRAFTGATTAVVSAAILHETPPSPRHLRPEIPPRLEQAILTALEKDREIRTQSAGELRAELMRIRREIDPSSDAPLAARATGGPASVTTDLRPSPGDPAPPASSSDAQIVVGLMRRHRGLVLGVAGLAALLVAFGLFVLGRRGASGPTTSGAATVSIADLTVEQLTTSGTAFAPAITPNGDYVVYVEQALGGDSLRVRQVATGSNVEIVPAEPGLSLTGATVTPDGAFVDYLKRVSLTSAELWRIPLLGGSPRRLIDNVGSAVGWSPDGQHMAYTRLIPPARTELVVAAADGTGERVLVARTSGGFFLILIPAIGGTVGPAWSPDGGTLAVLSTLPGTASTAGTGQIVFVDVASGSLRAIDFGPPMLGTALAWLDSTTLLASVLDNVSSPLQLWKVSYSEGTFSHLTNDVNQYSGISLTRDRGALVTSRRETSIGIWTSDASAGSWTAIVPERPVKGQAGFRLVWAGDDLLYVGGPDGDVSLQRWQRSTGKTETLALLAGGPSASRDGSRIAFYDHESGALTSMDADGRNRVRLAAGTPSGTITPDGRHVLIASQAAGRIYEAAVDGTGIVREIVQTRVASQAITLSMDGRRMAYQGFDDRGRPVTTVCDLPDCSAARVLPSLPYAQWMADGSSLAYLDPTASNIRVYPLDGRPPRPLTHFPDDGRRIWDFAWSADGRRLAVERGTTVNNIVLIRGLARSSR